MGERPTLNRSICAGVRRAIENELVAGFVGGFALALDEWYDEQTGKEWHGPRVQHRCAHIHRLLLNYLGQIERGEV